MIKEAFVGFCSQNNDKRYKLSYSDAYTTAAAMVVQWQWCDGTEHQFEKSTGGGTACY